MRHVSVLVLAALTLLGTVLVGGGVLAAQDAAALDY